MESFENTYNYLKEKYGEKYKPIKEKISTTSLLYVYFAWILFETVKMFTRRIIPGQSLTYMVFNLISTILVLFLVFGLCYKVNKKMEYWKIAPSFKNEVGRNFWSHINECIEYNPLRKDIDLEFYKKELNIFYNNSVLVDVEETLDYKNINMSTIKFNDSNKRRKNGIMVIISNCIKPIEKDTLKDLNFKYYDEIIGLTNKDNKLYLLFDAKEVFYFDAIDFLKEKDLKEDYDRFNEIVRLRDYV